MNQPILDIDNLSVVFDTPEGRISAIRNLSLTIQQGEILAVAGESGCGKSVLCRTIMGLLPHRAQTAGGSIRVCGRELTDLPDRKYCQIRGKDVAMVFQDPFVSLDPACSIGSQIAEAIRAHEKSEASDSGISPGHAKAGLRERVTDLLEAVGIDRAEERYDVMPWMLSGGMRQRCVLAMALAGNPRLLIADEPTTALDVTVQAEILDLLLQLRDERNLSVLFISHDLGVVSRVADTVAIMYAGRIVETGSTGEVLGNPAHPYTWGLLHALPAFAKDGRLRPIPGAPPSVPEGFKADAFAPRNAFALGIDYLEAPPFFEITPTHRVASWLADPRAPKVDFDNMPEPRDAVPGSSDAAAEKSGAQRVSAGNSVAHRAAGEKSGAQRVAQAAADSTASAPLLEVRGLSHSFRMGRHTSIDAVRDVSFEIRPGEIFSLVGESGCGKTTLARCVLGMYRPMKGTILYDGLNITRRDRGSIPRREDRNRLAREIQFISQDPGAALDTRMTVRELIAEPLRLHGICKSREEREEYIVSMLREVQLDERIMDRTPAQLSGGQKQRVSIARAYSMNPRLLVADEPLASLDVSIQAQIAELLQGLQLQHHTSILFISHDLSMVNLLSDRVAVMYQGQLVETGSAEAVFHDPQHPYTKKLLAAMPGPQPAVVSGPRQSPVQSETSSARAAAATYGGEEVRP